MAAQVVTYAPNSVPPKKESQLDGNVDASRTMGIAEIVLGSISIVLGIAAMVIASSKPKYASTWRSSLGLWCGFVVLITGISRITSKKQSSVGCLHIWNVLFSVITVFAASAALITSIIMASRSSIVSSALVWIHVATIVLHFVLLMLTTVYARYSCRDHSGRTVPTVYSQTQYTGFVQPPPGQGLSYGFEIPPTTALQFPQSAPQNTGLVQTPVNLGSNNRFGDQPTTVLPYAQSVPQGLGVQNQRSRAELPSAAYEEPDRNCRVPATPVTTAYTSYEAPNLALPSSDGTRPAVFTVNDLRNPPEPGQSAPTSNTGYEPPIATSSSTTRNIDYIEPNRIEHGRVPDARRPPLPLPPPPCQSTNAAVSESEGVYITLS